MFDTTLDAVKSSSPLQVFINARGGCGKTYVMNAVLAAVRSLKPGGCVGLAMATTGIAVNLLTLGQTFHSHCKAPLSPTEELVFNTLNPSGLSVSHLTLKPGMPVMLMRDLNQIEGLCNGTHLVFKHMISHQLLVCRIVGKDTNLFNLQLHSRK